MKKLLVFLLLSVFLYNQAGYFIAFNLQQREVRKEIKRKIKNSVPQEELTIIKIGKQDREDIRWVKEGKEFFYKDDLFDVVKVEQNSGEVVYHCINDTQEKELFVDLDEHVRNQMDADTTGNKKTKKNSVKDYFIESSSAAFIINSAIVYFSFTSEAPAGSFSKRFVPPPEQV